MKRVLFFVPFFLILACQGMDAVPTVSYEELIATMSDNPPKDECHWTYDLIVSNRSQEYHYIRLICFPPEDVLGSSFTNKLVLKIRKSEVRIREPLGGSLSVGDVTKAKEQSK